MKRAIPKLKINYQYEPSPEKLELALDFLAEDFKNRLDFIKKRVVLIKNLENATKK